MPYPITKVTRVNTNNLGKSFLRSESSQVKGRRRTKNIAGDFVRSAKPRAKPVNIATSNLFVLDNIIPPSNVKAPKSASIEATRAILSKKKLNGEIAQIRLDMIETIFFLKRSYKISNMINIVTNPLTTNRRLTLNNFSLKLL